jgi:ATP/maltotriose-dependent transcriptional regulator MalT
LGTRQQLRAKTTEFAMRAGLVSIEICDLRLRLNETIEFLRTYLGDTLDVDAYRVTIG